MSEREDLAKLVFMADNSAAGDAEKEWAFLRQSPKYLRYAYDIADAVLAAGYVKR